MRMDSSLQTRHESMMLLDTTIAPADSVMGLTVDGA